MELIYYLIFLDRDKMDVYWDKTSCFLHNPLDQSKDASVLWISLLCEKRALLLTDMRCLLNGEEKVHVW